MVYVDIENKVKYDTDKMELVSTKIRVEYGRPFWDTQSFRSVKLYRSKKGKWLAVAEGKNLEVPVMVSEEKAEEMLIQYDVNKYEEIFGELEEA